MDRPPETRAVEIEGRPLTCPVCGQDRSWSRKTLLNTAAMTFLGLDWADKRADNYICDRCGHILWFLADKPH